MSQAVNYLPEVREQYEEFPYPDRNPKDEKKGLRMGWLGRMDSVNHNCFSGQQRFQNFRMLVAGGGTGDATISWAEQLRGRGKSEVVYLDFSKTSMAIAQKRAAMRKLTNIKWVHDSILNIPDLDLGTFDFIDCTGVLHHLEDPNAGLKALTSVLKTGGAMNLMVYAPYGRIGVYQMQDLMRLVNRGENNPRVQVQNTKTMVKSLPQNHWLNLSRQLGLVSSDMDNDAGLYDLFLHTQDRAYSILEVHDWLENCGLKMTGEPGCQNAQLQYLPETFIQDQKILDKINGFPLKIRQAIGEALSGVIFRHEFYAVHQDADNGVCDIADETLVPWAGMTPVAAFDVLAQAVEKAKQTITLTFDKAPGKPQLTIPEGRFVPALLRRIDGQRTTGDIIADVCQDSSLQNLSPTPETVMQDFKTLITTFHRGHSCFLKAQNIEDLPTLQTLNTRVK